MSAVRSATVARRLRLLVLVSLFDGLLCDGVWESVQLAEVMCPHCIDESTPAPFLVRYSANFEQLLDQARSRSDWSLYSPMVGILHSFEGNIVVGKIGCITCMAELLSSNLLWDDLLTIVDSSLFKVETLYLVCDLFLTRKIILKTE